MFYEKAPLLNVFYIVQFCCEKLSLQEVMEIKYDLLLQTDEYFRHDINMNK